MKQLLLLLLITLLFLAGSCSSDSVAGGSTTVENGFVAVTVAFNKNPVSVDVQLIPSSYNPLTNEGGTIRLVHSDSAGAARFDSVAPGDYALLVLEDTIGRYRSNVTLNQTIELELERTGTIIVRADSVNSLGVVGTPFTGTVDETSGTVTFTNVPAGTYNGVVTDSVQTTTDITVEPEKTTDVTIEQTLFTITPMDLGDELKLWSVSDLSTGAVNTLWAATFDGGLHYHNGTSWLFIGALYGIPSNQMITGVSASGAVPNGEESERVIAHGEQIYMLRSNVWYEITTGNPPFIGRTVITSDVNEKGTTVLAFENAIYFNTDFEGGWYEVPIAGTNALYCATDTIWAGTDNALYAIDLVGKNSREMASGFGNINAIDYKDGIVAATDSGLVEQVGSEWIVRERSPNNLNYLAVDSSGTVWAVKENSGIVKFADSGTIYFYLNESLATSITSITGRSSALSAAIGANGIVLIE